MSLSKLFQKKRINTETPSDVLTPRSSLVAALSLLKESTATALPVLDHDRFVGVVFRDDVMIYAPSPATTLSKWELPQLLQKVSIMELIKEVPQVSSKARVDDILQLMVAKHSPVVAIVDGQHLQKLVDWEDVLKEVLAICGNLRQEQEELPWLKHLHPYLAETEEHHVVLS